MAMTTEQRLTQRVINRIGKAIGTYNLIRENDKILVAISGGKDSLVMLDVLATQLGFLNISYDLEAIHVQMEDIPGETDTDYIQEFCNARDVPLHFETARAGITQNAKKSPCFACAWNRRKQVFFKSKDLGCNKIAFGHHTDDALETLLMNMTYHGEYSSMPPRLSMFKGEFEIIRPAILTKAKEMERYTQIHNIREAEGNCPYGDTSKREEFREIIGKMSGMHKRAKENLFRAMSNIYQDYLPPEDESS